MGLLPVLAAVALANDAHLGLPAGRPAASAPVATPAAVPGLVVAGPGEPTSSQTQSTLDEIGVMQADASKPGTTAALTQAASADAQAGQSAAAAQSGPAAPTGSAPGPFRAYRVQPGDTVKFVARMYGVSPLSVAQASGLQNPDRLSVGQVLTVPTQPGSLYRLQPGETLDQVAARTGVASDVIASASKLTTNAARAGDVILIPDMAYVAGK